MTEFPLPETHIIRDFFKALVPLSFIPWFLKKKWQSFARTHLSFYVAVIMTFVVLRREWSNVSSMAIAPTWPHGTQWLVLAGLLGVIYTLKLELLDRRYAVSSQENLFHVGTRLAMEELEKFGKAVGTPEEIETQFGHFADLLLEIAAQTFSLGKRVETGLMVKIPEQQILKLVKWSNRAKYDPKLAIPIPADHNSGDTGPAGLAFARNCLVYVPKKNREKPKRAWLFTHPTRNPHSFIPLNSSRCWVKSENQEQEDFRSVISVPIAGLGVLNFSTQRRDPFTYRDFLMAQYFARVLAQASYLRTAKAGR